MGRQGLETGLHHWHQPRERLEKQNASIDLSIQVEAEVAEYTLQIEGGFETWRRLIRPVCDVGSPFVVQQCACGVTPIRLLKSLPSRHWRLFLH